MKFWKSSLNLKAIIETEDDKKQEIRITDPVLLKLLRGDAKTKFFKLSDRSVCTGPMIENNILTVIDLVNVRIFHGKLNRITDTSFENKDYKVYTKKQELYFYKLIVEKK